MAVKSGSPVFALPVDVPAAGPEVWKRLMEALLSREKQETCAVHAAVPSREGRGGHPVLLAPAFVAHLLSLPPHEGRLDEAIARLERVARVPVTDERVQMNLNTAEDWRKLRARSHGTRAGDR
jgi:CTP:molybdopterin cytidylyltransferase MocA